jgi:formylmethanofuran dehydrogenase subunit C
LPRTANGEAAFAASNTNIVIKGNNTWIVSGGMKAGFSILQIREYLGSIRYANCTRESDDWHFTADFMTLKGFIAGATMKR